LCGLFAAIGLGVGTAGAQDQPVLAGAAVRDAAEAVDSQLAPMMETGPYLSNRAAPPFAGISNGCQASNATGFLTSPAYRRADNFKPAANSTINGVSFAGYYRLATSQSAGTAPASQTFEVRFLSDNGGVPGALFAGPFTVTPTATPNGTFGNPAATVNDYVATLPMGVAVQGGTCYWLEIHNTNTAGQRWYWLGAGPIPGDTISYFSANDGTYDVWEQVANDMNWCLDVELANTLDSPSCTIAVSPAACMNPDTNGQPRAGATTGFSSNLSGSTTVTGGSSVAFERAEAFRLTSTGDITNVCFWAFWNPFGTVGGFSFGGGLPGNPDLRVTYYANDPITGVTPGAILAQYTVGQAGVTLRYDTPGIHRIDHPAVHVLAGECYYISISYLSQVADTSRQARFIWGFSNSTGANTDGLVLTRNTSTTPIGDWGFTATGSPARGLSFLFNVGDSVLPCSPPAATNGSCAAATPLTIGAAPIAGNNINLPAMVLPPCQFSLVFGGIAWYTLVGDGNTVTVTTCNPGRVGDPNMNVYCASSCAGPFNCVVGNNDLGAGCTFGATSAGVTFPTIAGSTYYVTVMGSGGGQAVYMISATSDGVPANPAADACPTFNRCENSALPADLLEPDPCTTSTATNTNATCATATVYPAFGQTVGGRVSTYVNGTTNTRDFDYWLLPAVSVPTVVTWKINSEFPTLYQFQRFAVNCSSTATVTAGATRTACFDQFLGEATLQPGGLNVLLISAPDFQGLPCPDFNDYRVTVSLVPTGTCCVPASVCFVTTVTDCTNQAGVFTVNAACTPTDPCVVTPTGACCAGTTCSVIEQSACSGANTHYAGDNSTCNAAGNNTTPCCKADFNQNGSVTVQDIFDFLAAYFSANTLADINGVGGVTVQDIFDYLAAYFGGCA
jgi:hypothetical protein